MSLSKKRPKKWRTSSVNAPISGLPHDCDDFASRCPDILLFRELAEDLLERRQMHQIAQAADLVVGDDLALVQHDDPRTNLLRNFEHVRDIENGLARAGHLRDHFVQQQRGRYVEAGEWLAA